jgi:hypothetical protein
VFTLCTVHLSATKIRAKFAIQMPLTCWFSLLG